MAPFGILFAIVFIIPCCVSPFGFFTGSRIRANLRAERTAGTFWTFLACQREDSSTRWKNWMLIEEYGCE